MKIYNEIILKWNDDTNSFDTLYEDSFEYDGEMLLAEKGRFIYYNSGYDEEREFLQEIKSLPLDQMLEELWNYIEINPIPDIRIKLNGDVVDKNENI
jgi:predicted mannosyl-3-phosphoglycerate phosphatase (HAD superfamily)